MDFSPDSDLEDLPTSPPPALQSQSPVDQSEIEGYLNDYPYASEPSYFTRPNRYHGPPSTWRSWTANDRAVAESLDTIRASDLSIHLYNSFDLKRRNRSAPHVRHDHASYHPDDKVASDNDQPIIDQRFIPPEVWTAWPLRSHHVPRSPGILGGVDGTLRRGQKIRPSTSLEDALLATTLKYARGRWEIRKSEPKHLRTRSTINPWKNEHDAEQSNSKHFATTEDEQNGPASPQSGETDARSNAERNLNADDDMLMDEHLPQGVQYFSSQAFAAADSSSSSEDEVPSTNSEDEFPVFSADDNLAHNLSRPSIRHLLAKFDGLLDGLHKARAAYALRGDSAGSRSRSRSVFSDTEMTDDDNFVRSGSRAITKKRGRKRKRSNNPSDSERLQQSSPRGRSTVRVSEKKNQAYGLRDWSDVLGMATLTGWDIETVARASERCAKLFNQNMTFRTFHQGPIDGKVGSQQGPWFEEEVAYVPVANEAGTRDRSQSLPSRGWIEGWQKAQCIRTSSRCPRCQNHKIRCDPPKSMSVIDFTQPVPCAACSSILNLDAPCPGIMIRPKIDKRCPYPDCTRHDPLKPFLKNSHLQRHLTDVHGHVYSPPTSPMTKEHHPSDRFDVTTEDQIRPSAAMTCPMKSCPQSTRIYKRPTRLYDHIRKAHPEFDVASLKKIVARTGGRGRYDRSRSHSRGRVPAQDDFVDWAEKYEKQGEYGAEESRGFEYGIPDEEDD